MNLCSPLQKLVSDRRVDEALEPNDELRHVPLTAKHPEVRFIPLAKVEEAIVEVTERRFVDIPPINVDVAVVVANILPTVN